MGGTKRLTVAKRPRHQGPDTAPEAPTPTPTPDTNTRHHTQHHTQHLPRHLQTHPNHLNQPPLPPTASAPPPTPPTPPQYTSHYSWLVNSLTPTTLTLTSKKTFSLHHVRLEIIIESSRKRYKTSN